MKSAVNLIPMAGVGARFARDKFTDPKPLIDVGGEPMIIRATKNLPDAGRWVFICRKEHLEEYALQKTLKNTYRGCTIVAIDYLTEGQASTCLVAEQHIDKDNSLLISACDNGMLYNEDLLDELIRDSSIDALIFTFRNNVTATRNPQMYGWVKVDKHGRVEQVSVKVPISSDPAGDHAVVGTFWFRRGKYFTDAAREMIKSNTRINNEFYVDECVNNAVAAGLNVRVFEVDKYICWGTPQDLATYNYWREYFKNYHIK